MRLRRFKAQNSLLGDAPYQFEVLKNPEEFCMIGLVDKGLDACCSSRLLDGRTRGMT